MEENTYYIVTCEESFGIKHTTAFEHKVDAQLFCKILQEKRPEYKSYIEECKKPMIHKSLTTACQHWRF